ncbi:partner and localizer of BRCA2 isoform X2 [Heterodontus francisci]|uniref:partner and localizer of BRCA2 isoform X2 n=1 Tax=Heterodontus francisci TaxID=7792 RepID=UPI00355BC1ED
MESSLKKPLTWEAREQLKERLALLKKEYAKTVYKLQRAQKTERVRKHVKSTIVHQNKLLEEQSKTQLTTGEASPFLDTRQSSSPYQRSRDPVEDSNEKKSAVTFNLEPEIINFIGSPNLALASICESVEDPSAESITSPVVETDLVTKTDSRIQSRLKLKKKRSCEILTRELCEAANGVNESLVDGGEPCVKEIKELDPTVNEENARSSSFNRGGDVSESQGRDVKENARCKVFHGSPQGEEHSVSLKNRAQVVESDCLTSPVGRTVNDTVCCSPGDKSTAVSMCKNEAFISSDPEVLTEATQPQQAKPNCSENLIDACESNVASEAVVLEPDRLQTSTAVCEAPEDSPLNSCTLVEGLLFPVEYYVRTTRRMTSCQRRVDLDAVIHSHLGKCRNGGRGRSRKSAHDQSCPVKGSPKAEGEISDTLLLFNSQEDDVGGSDAASLQHDSQDPWNIAVDSQSIKSRREKGGKRGRGESIKSKLTDAEVFKDQEHAEWTLNNHRIPHVHAVTSDVQSERGRKGNESNFCQSVSNTNELYGNTVNNLSSHEFSSSNNLNIKSSNLYQNKLKHIVKPLQNSIKSQTNDVLVRPFKEDTNSPSTAQGESVLSVPEHHLGLNSDTDSQEMIPETQQDLFLDISLKRNFSGTKQSFPLGIDSNRAETRLQVSQPRRRVRLSKGNYYRRTSAGSRKFPVGLEDGTLTCSEPLLPVKKPIVKRLFHSLEVQDFDLPDEDYGQLKEKLRTESLRKSLLPSQHNIIDCTVETQVKAENWDTGHCENPHSQDIKQATENLEEPHPQKSSDYKELSRTPEEPVANDVIYPYGQEMPETTSGYKLFSSVLLSTPSCTPQAGSIHQHEQGAGSPMFPSLGFTPASSSPVLSQSSCRNQNWSQTGTLPHVCEDVRNNDGNYGQKLQTPAEGVVAPVIREGTQCILSARKPLDKKDEQPEEHFHGNCGMKFSQPAVLNEDCAVKSAEAGTIEEENDVVLTPALPDSQLEQKLKNQTLQLISKIQNPSTSCVIDLCTVFWMLKEARTLCIACACETAVFLWAPQGLNQWTNIHTWTFDKAPIIELIPIPDSVNILCVAFGSLEIREVKVLHSTERGCLEHTLLQEGDINAVLGLPGRRLVCSCGTLQSQHIELSTLSKEGRSERCMQLIPPNEMVLAFSEVEGETEALIGSTIMSNIVIWNLKTGHLLKKIHLSESYPGTVCQKAYSESGILFILLSHRYVGTCNGSVGRRVCVLRMVGVNPMNGKSRPVMSYTLPLECSGRYLDGGVKDQSIAAVVTPGTLVLWDVLSGHILTMLQHGPNVQWSLFHWAEANSCLLARKNDRTVYIYKCIGAGMVDV